MEENTENQDNGDGWQVFCQDCNEWVFHRVLSYEVVDRHEQDGYDLVRYFVQCTSCGHKTIVLDFD